MQDFTVQYFIHNALVGQSRVPSPVPSPESTCFFCRDCGEIWGRVWFTTPQTRFRVVTAACERHKAGPWDFISVSGSVLEDMFPRALDERAAFWPLTVDYLPEGMLRRELNLLLKELP
jgi:hypothetical protein